MKRFSALILSFCFFVSCGSVETFQPSRDTEINAASYQYIDGFGNLYNISARQFEYIPVSADDTVDGVEDRGRRILKSISLNTYGKLAAAFKNQFTRQQLEQDTLTVANRFARLIKTHNNSVTAKQLDRQAVISLNDVVEPIRITQE
ncbi:MAG: hypothetical protein WBG71_03115 [Leeuwenhoekiella sp.]